MENEITDVLHSNAGGFSGNTRVGNTAARLLASGFNVNSLRTNDLLRKDEWVRYDETIVDIARERLIGVGDLISRGLTYNLPNALGTTRLEWEKMGDMDEANIDMSAVTEGDRDRLTFELEGIPIPVIHKDFQLNIRVLEASRTTGQPLDTTTAAVAARKVADKIENLLFNGGYSVGSNGTIYGYTNAPNRNTGSVTATWATASGEQIVGDILAMQGASIADNMYGPWMLYVPTNVFVALGDDYKAASDKSIIERIREIPGIIDVKPTNRLTAPNVLLVQFTSDVVDMVVGMQPTPLEWQEMGGLIHMFKVMAIMVPRIKSDSASQSGIVHYS